MRVGILTTDHGSHPPEKWAAETAAQITDVIVIDPDSIVLDAMTSAKTQFTKDLEAALVDSHDTVQCNEKDALDAYGHARHEHSDAPEDDHVNEALWKVQTIADKTMFASHFRKPEVQTFIRSTLISHFTTVNQIERAWHLDKNPVA